MQNDQYLYHYYFNIYKDAPELIVRKEPYTINRKGNYRIKTNLAYRQVSPDDIGKVIAGNAVILLERDDAKARTIFTESLMQKIYKKHSEIKRMIVLYSVAALQEIKSNESPEGI